MGWAATQLSKGRSGAAGGVSPHPIPDSYALRLIMRVK